jgi:membrane AbrB-like protein
MLGSAFTPAILGNLREWAGGFALLLLYLPLATALCYVVFRRIGRMNPTTAYFSATPGGLNEMVLVGSAMGGDTPVIALVHAIRIFLVVMIIPFYFRFVEHVSVSSTAAGPGLLATDPLDALMLLGCAVIGGPVAKRLAFPAALLIGPMLLSAGVHLGGLTSGRPPWELVALAQVVIGAGLGTRFVGLKLHRVGGIMLVSLLATLLMLALGAAFTVALHDFAGTSAEGVMLAYAPGGLAEMSLVALALGVDTAYVASMHLVRVILVIFCAPAIWRRWLGPWLKRRGKAT